MIGPVCWQRQHYPGSAVIRNSLKCATHLFCTLLHVLQTSDGNVYDWTGAVDVPVLREGLPPIAKISIESGNSMFLARNGPVWSQSFDDIFIPFGAVDTAEPAVVFDGAGGGVASPQPVPTTDNGSLAVSGPGISQLPAEVQPIFTPTSYSFDGLLNTHLWTVSVANVEYNLSIISGVAVSFNQTVNSGNGTSIQGFFLQGTAGVTFNDDSVPFENVTLSGSVLDPPQPGDLIFNGILGTSASKAN